MHNFEHCANVSRMTIEKQGQGSCILNTVIKKTIVTLVDVLVFFPLFCLQDKLWLLKFPLLPRCSESQQPHGPLLLIILGMAINTVAVQ